MVFDFLKYVIVFITLSLQLYLHRGRGHLRSTAYADTPSLQTCVANMLETASLIHFQSVDLENARFN
jgi:hypothetical protein